MIGKLQVTALSLIFMCASVPLHGQEIMEFSGQWVGLISGGADMADIDGDGDLDAITTGKDEQGQPRTILYINNGPDGFQAAGSGLTPLWLSDAAFGDFDRDGDTYLVIAGPTSASPPYRPVTHVYRNNGAGQFSEMAAGSIDGVYGCDLSWGDYNGNGTLDLLIVGKNATNQVTSKVYEYTGGSFVNVTGNKLVGVWLGSGDWGDLDNDNDLDILITGQNAQGKPLTVIYENTGSRNFVPKRLNITPVNYSKGVWFDYNRDGQDDILVAGRKASGQIVTHLFKNEGSNGFVQQSQIRFPGVAAGDVVVNDFDNNSYPDILLTGNTGSGNPISRIYVNQWGSGFSQKSDVSLPGLKFSNAGWANAGSTWNVVLIGQDAASKPAATIVGTAPAKEIQFQVVQAHNSQPVRNARILVNGETLTTDRNGLAAIEADEGSFDYQVSANGYLPATGSVSVGEESVEAAVSLNKLFQFALTVYDADTQQPISNARFQVGNRIAYTDATGRVSIDTLAGTYQYVLEADGFSEEQGQFTLTTEDASQELQLVGRYPVQFTVSNKSTGQSASGVTLMVDNQNYTADRKGHVEIMLRKGTYPYSIVSDDYLRASGSIQVQQGGASETVALTPVSQVMLTFINANTKEPVPNYYVQVAGKNFLTDADGVVAFDTINGQYSYSSNFMLYVPVNGQITVDNKDVEKEVLLQPYYKVLFVVKDARTKEPIKNALIQVEDKELTTNASGMAVMDTTNGTYTYRVKVGETTYTSNRFQVKGSGVRMTFMAD